jgi:hypothetical protein
MIERSDSAGVVGALLFTLELNEILKGFWSFGLGLGLVVKFCSNEN